MRFGIKVGPFIAVGEGRRNRKNAKRQGERYKAEKRQARIDNGNARASERETRALDRLEQQLGYRPSSSWEGGKELARRNKEASARHRASKGVPAAPKPDEYKSYWQSSPGPSSPPQHLSDP